MRCTHCGSENYVNNGSYKGNQRYKCKNCGRYFSDKVRKFSYEDKEKILKMHSENMSINKIAQTVGCSVSTVAKMVG